MGLNLAYRVSHPSITNQMKRTPLIRKKPWRWTPKDKTRANSLLRRSNLAKKSKAPSAVIKDEIQDLVREIAILRDGGCVLRDLQHLSIPCGYFRKDGQLVLQGDHLITRGNSATYADSRLVVCACVNHHAWKSKGGNLNKNRYDALVRSTLSKERKLLWELAEQNRGRPQHMTTADWKLQKIALEQELAILKQSTVAVLPH